VCGFNQNRAISTNFILNRKYKVHENRSGASLSSIRTDGRTYLTKLIVAYCSCFGYNL